jgi:hypothetical protein
MFQIPLNEIIKFLPWRLCDWWYKLTLSSFYLNWSFTVSEFLCTALFIDLGWLKGKFVTFKSLNFSHVYHSPPFFSTPAGGDCPQNWFSRVIVKALFWILCVWSVNLKHMDIVVMLQVRSGYDTKLIMCIYYTHHLDLYFVWP